MIPTQRSGIYMLPCLVNMEYRILKHVQLSFIINDLRSKKIDKKMFDINLKETEEREAGIGKTASCVCSAVKWDVEGSDASFTYTFPAIPQNARYKYTDLQEENSKDIQP